MSEDYVNFMKLYNAIHFNPIHDIKVKIHLKDIPMITQEDGFDGLANTVQKIYCGGEKIRYQLWINKNKCFSYTQVFTCKLIEIGPSIKLKVEKWFQNPADFDITIL